MENEFHEYSAEELLGPLNEVEHKYAPKRLFVAGDRNILGEGPRVSIVGSRKASPLGIKRAQMLASLLAKRGMSPFNG